MDLFEEFIQLISKFEDERIEYALCGGLAMAVYAFPRATLDIDIMIERENLEKAQKAAKESGFSVDVGLLKFKEGAIEIYRLTKISDESGDPLVLDLLLVTPATLEIWRSRQRLPWERGDLSVVSPQGLIELKSMRQSGQDQDDIEHLRRIFNED